MKNNIKLFLATLFLLMNIAVASEDEDKFAVEKRTLISQNWNEESTALFVEIKHHNANPLLVINRKEIEIACLKIDVKLCLGDYQEFSAFLNEGNPRVSALKLCRLLIEVIDEKRTQILKASIDLAEKNRTYVSINSSFDSHFTNASAIRLRFAETLGNAIIQEYTKPLSKHPFIPTPTFLQISDEMKAVLCSYEFWMRFIQNVGVPIEG